VEVSGDVNDAVVVEIESVPFLDDGDPVSTVSFFLPLSAEDDEQEESLLLVPPLLLLPSWISEPTELYSVLALIASSLTDVIKLGIP
jgi:hypothetical protein